MLTVIFTTSLILITAMIAFKSVEENKGKKLFFPGLRSLSDIFAIKIIKDIKIFFAILSRKNAKLFVLFMVDLVLTGLAHLKRKSGIEKLKFPDSFKDEKRTIRKKGPSSFFLKNVSEYKNIR